MPAVFRVYRGVKLSLIRLKGLKIQGFSNSGVGVSGFTVDGLVVKGTRPQMGKRFELMRRMPKACEQEPATTWLLKRLKDCLGTPSSEALGECSAGTRAFGNSQSKLRCPNAGMSHSWSPYAFAH